MTDLERIVALANHGIIRTPEVKSTTKILKEAPVQPGQRGFTPGVQEPEMRLKNQRGWTPGKQTSSDPEMRLKNQRGWTPGVQEPEMRLKNQRGWTPGVQEPEMRLKNQRGFTPGVQTPQLEPTTTASQADAGRMMDINNPLSTPASQADAGRMMDINNPVSITVLPDVDEVPDQIPASQADAGRMMDINNPQGGDIQVTSGPVDTIQGQDNNPNRDDYTQEEWDKICLLYTSPSPRDS